LDRNTWHTNWSAVNLQFLPASWIRSPKAHAHVKELTGNWDLGGISCVIV
jgi:hypothetical protein